MWASLGSSSLGLCALPGLICLFTSPGEGTFLSLFFHRVFNFLLSLFPFQHHHLQMVVPLKFSFILSLKRLLTLPSFFVFFLEFCYFDWVFFAFLSSKLLIWSSASTTPLLIPCNGVLVSDRFYFLVFYLHFYVSYLFIEILTEIIEHPYNQCFELYIWRIFYLRFV